MRRVVATILATAVTVAVAGCANPLTSASPPATTPSTPEVASITDTQIVGDQLVRVTGTVMETDAPGCLLLDTGTTTYLLLGGNSELIEPDAEVTVTGTANPMTPTPCTGGTPLTITEVLPAE